MRVLLLFASLFVSLVLYAQEDQARLHGKPIDRNRYIGIKNSPYLFEDWKRVSIIPSSGLPIENIAINFNGYTQNFEAKINDQIIEVELGYFIGMKIDSVDSVCGRQSFLKFNHPKLTNKYPLFVFNGRKYRLIKDFRVSLAENKVETPGKTEKFQSFVANSSYYLMNGAEIELIKLSRKEILQKLGSPDVETYINANEIDLGTEQGLCQLLNWLDIK